MEYCAAKRNKLNKLFFGMTKYSILQIAVLTILISSCDSGAFFEENRGIPEGIWNRHDIPVFKVDVEDTLQIYNVFINVRNTGNYPKSNLYLFVTTSAPGGAFTRDTVECILAYPSGEWTGRGFGNIRQNRFPYRRHVRFPDTGEYTFEIEQAMRMEDLPGITDIGIRIEKVDDH